MNFGYTAKYQPLISTLLLAIIFSFAALIQACKPDNTQKEPHATLFHPDSIPIVSASQNRETISATRAANGILLSYTGTLDQAVKIRIYDGQNRLVYGERELMLKANEPTPIKFENISKETYQLFAFFDNGEFLLAEIPSAP